MNDIHIEFPSLQTICKPAPFNTDEDAVLERERCDYSIKITYEMAKSGTEPMRVSVCVTLLTPCLFAIR